MPPIKNGQISLYCHFNKIIKGPGASFQFLALSQKHARAFQVAVRGREGNQKLYWGRFFLPGEGNLRRSDFDDSNLFQN